MSKQPQPADKFMHVGGLHLRYLDWDCRMATLMVPLHDLRDYARNWDIIARTNSRMARQKERGHHDQSD